MKRGELYARLVERLPRIVWSEYGRKDTCIPAAYHAMETLRSQGVPAKVASYDVIAMNQRFHDWLHARDNDNDHAPMPPDAWSVGITHGNPDATGYLSHLVCVSKGLVIDCAAGSMSRPQRGMPVPDGLLVRQGVWTGGPSIVLYNPSPEPVPPMWQLDPWGAARVRARIETEILKGETDDKGK